MPHPTTLWRVAAVLVLSGVGLVEAPAQRSGSPGQPWGVHPPLGTSPESINRSAERSDSDTEARMPTLRTLTISRLEARGGSTPAGVTVPGLGPSALPMEFHAGIVPAFSRVGKDRLPLLLLTRVTVQFRE